MDGGDCEGAYGVLFDRFRSLEASHNKLREQLGFLLQENKTGNATTCREEETASDCGDAASFPGWGYLRGAHFRRSPYRNVLEYVGHAVHVSRGGSDEIIYWNCAAEKLYGYKAYEVVGQRVLELLFHEEYHRSAQAIMERLRNGGSWSGQLPLRKRSGQTFMAMVTKSPLYEDDYLVGIVTVSSDAAVFNKTNMGNTRTHQDRVNEQSNVHRMNSKKIQRHPQPQIAAVPQLASSVSNLASKVLLRRRADGTGDTGRSTRESEEAEVDGQNTKSFRPPRAPIAKPSFSFIGRRKTEAMSSGKEESTSESAEPSKIAVKFFSKLKIRTVSNLEGVMDESIQQNGSEDNLTRRDSAGNTPHICNLDASEEDGFSDDAERKHPHMHMNTFVANGNSSNGAYKGCFTKSCFKSNEHELAANVPAVDSDDASPIRSDSHKLLPSSDESYGSSSSKGDNDSIMVVNPEIRWDDLQLREEIGQGSFAVVHRGVWNGSDVAVKVYTGSQYNEETLVDYKKEIDIMQKLRHPNVLLFMGAVCTEEKLAMVTEYMTRGSLFKTLHRNNQSLDIRRRLRMAIDVARGMNYLHHRNPPIVHRDLKSSNLLVDKSWTVKVGDFGLSKLKYATFLTAKSGRGTPQWMAPEVLRNEPSTEKSDVYSFGVILWELMTKRIPWNNINSLQVVGIVGFMDQRLDLPEDIDPHLSSIISDCWRSNPEDRPSFEDIIRRLKTSRRDSVDD